MLAITSTPCQALGYDARVTKMNETASSPEETSGRERWTDNIIGAGRRAYTNSY